MSYNRFQGDPAVRLTKDGASMEFIDGQPVMDQGIENAVSISLFTKPGWWGNVLLTDENKKIGATFQEVRVAIDLQTINDYTDAAMAALAWMKKVKLASETNITVTNPYTNYINTEVYIKPLGQDIQELLFTQNGLNWISQANNPAHERFSNDI